MDKLFARHLMICIVPSAPILFLCGCLISVRSIMLLPKSQSYPQMQFGQCIVGYQCFSNLLCSFISNFIDLRMFDFSQKYYCLLLPKSQSHLQMQCCQCVVDCQCLSNPICSFCSDFIFL